VYLSLLKDVNDIDISNAKLKNALEYKDDLDGVELDLNRFREKKKRLLKSKAHLAFDKAVGEYSNQDSRRKVQRKFFSLEREGKELNVDTFGKLASGDLFKLNSFVPPGVYTKEKPTIISFKPSWSNVDIFEVEPLTRYSGSKHPERDLGYIELTLTSNDGGQAFVIGNIPVDLLVFQDDFRIPGFGVGVLSTSELVERRYLRLSDGPRPAYCFLVDCVDSSTYHVVNNHKIGYEQIYVRPFLDEHEKLFLRVTINSYERIVDLLEFEIPLSGELEDRIRAASEQYSPPLFRVYSDSNVF